MSTKSSTAKAKPIKPNRQAQNNRYKKLAKAVKTSKIGKKK